MSIEMRILIDSAEQKPFEFLGLTVNPVRKTCLGRHPNGRGDYTTESLQGVCHVERKSVCDLQSTLLGWKGGRKRFENELANLAGLDSSLVVVEGSFGSVIETAPSYGVKSAAENARILGGTVVSLMARHRVQWLFADDRRMAEIFAFRFLEKCERLHRTFEKSK